MADYTTGRSSGGWGGIVLILLGAALVLLMLAVVFAGGGEDGTEIRPGTDPALSAPAGTDGDAMPAAPAAPPSDG